jgi:GxxExxY protein
MGMKFRHFRNEGQLAAMVRYSRFEGLGYARRGRLLQNYRMARMTRISATGVEIVEKELSYLIVKAFFEVYNELGFGFLEQIYARALEIVLRRLGLNVERELPVPVVFEGEQIGFHRVDMVVERRVLIEIKACERLADTSHQQVRNYLSAFQRSGHAVQLGILLHFGPKAKYYRHLPGRRIRTNSSDSRDSVVQ